MSFSALHQIEESINRLSTTEQLWLIEQLAQRIRKTTFKPPSLEAQLAEMAADPDIQSELRKIDAEFAMVEGDGLEAI